MKPLHSIKEWVFDLDNTLYPLSAGIQCQADKRMPDYIMRFLGIDFESARKIQKDYYLSHGTTLSGLVKLHGADPHHYWDFIFDIDYTVLKRDLALQEVLSNLPGRKWVHTNSPRKHAQKILSQLGVEKFFSGVFDLEDAEFISKPGAENYRKMVARHAIDPKTSIFIDDVARNLVPASQLGMATLWVKHPDCINQPDEDMIPDYKEHIDYETEDMVGWLRQVKKETTCAG